MNCDISPYTSYTVYCRNECVYDSESMENANFHGNQMHTGNVCYAVYNWQIDWFVRLVNTHTDQ